MEFGPFFFILLRILVPLLILKKPLAGGILAFFLDAIDHDTTMKLEQAGIISYQQLDKALDMYYLALEFYIVRRYWKNLFAKKAGILLFLYRLLGVFLFEITGFRIILIIFPNIFEYFFLFYETCKKFTNPLLIKKSTIVIMLIILLFIKIPQEYFIHYENGSSRKWIQEHIFNKTSEDIPWKISL
jgi:hypothetical protein